MTSSGDATAAGAADTSPKSNASTKKIRIQAFDSMRFFLILNIVLGHFIAFANPSSAAVLKFCSQHNVLVGAFFALSGYVTVRRYM
jgi:peptidoglycan/LPS O-acetylase OafA/YrhL